MRTINIDELNSFLADSYIPYQAIEKLPASGQREVYLAISLKDKKKYILKVAHYSKYTIARIQREIQILNCLESPFFPKIILDTFVAKEIFDLYYDNLHTAQKYLEQYYPDLENEYQDEVDAYQSDPITPFYLTVENFVENISWDDFEKSTNELIICEFIKLCFTGLELLWNNKIVHRDLKPDNILIRSDNSPVIIDLGIAKSFNDGTIDLTPGFFKNPHTVRYASPEQLLDKKEAISYKTDQYAIGLIAYRLLCNEWPFGNVEEIGVEELVENMMSFNYIPIGDNGGECCGEFEEFIKKLLKPEPHQRYRTTKKIFQTLDTIHGLLK